MMPARLARRLAGLLEGIAGTGLRLALQGIAGLRRLAELALRIGGLRGPATSAASSAPRLAATSPAAVAARARAAGRACSPACAVPAVAPTGGSAGAAPARCSRSGGRTAGCRTVDSCASCELARCSGGAACCGWDAARCVGSGALSWIAEGSDERRTIPGRPTGLASSTAGASVLPRPLMEWDWPSRGESLETGTAELGRDRLELDGCFATVRKRSLCDAWLVSVALW
mmetsp:Transcript_36180/g.84989  ORF Transcript_36180/g.84989 Transcript_36180/m.84989 type:complete len:229 (+) Transcript_36180:633-1319(+)